MQSDLNDAAVSIAGGKSLGTTPLALDLAPGPYVVTVRKGKLPAWKMTVDVALGTTTPAFATLSGFPADKTRTNRADCDRGEAIGCEQLGKTLASSSDATIAAEAPSLIERACLGGRATACTQLGTMYVFGQSVTADKETGFSWYRRGCDGGDSNGCTLLKMQSCESGKAIDCTATGIMHLRGSGGVAKDPQLAAELFKKACDAGDPYGCSNLGGMLDAGFGIAKDTAAAAVLFRRACDGGVQPACSRAAPK